MIKGQKPLQTCYVMFIIFLHVPTAYKKKTYNNKSRVAYFGRYMWIFILSSNKQSITKTSGISNRVLIDDIYFVHLRFEISKRDLPNVKLCLSSSSDNEWIHNRSVTLTVAIFQNASNRSTRCVVAITNQLLSCSCLLGTTARGAAWRDQRGSLYNNAAFWRNSGPSLGIKSAPAVAYLGKALGREGIG